MSTLRGVVNNNTARGTTITVLQLRYEMPTIQCLAVSFEEVGEMTERVFKIVLFVILHFMTCKNDFPGYPKNNLPNLVKDILDF